MEKFAPRLKKTSVPFLENLLYENAWCDFAAPPNIKRKLAIF